LIKANTADDSDDDLSDIPEDLEQKILSGRKSRGNFVSKISYTLVLAFTVSQL